jgi:hypothetical protein
MKVPLVEMLEGELARAPAFAHDGGHPLRKGIKKEVESRGGQPADAASLPRLGRRIGNARFIPPLLDILLGSLFGD